ncbi:MAG: BTAD domain-containing putative transcriptional regulator [Bacillota bacterium]|nr:BTAD domain-containing putative transcriptional regulator [Bacillota bacterium]
MESVLRVNMLGEFTLAYEDKIIDDRSTRSKKLWLLLEYLITFREKEISQNDLIELLWPEDEIDNPANALKTLLFRVRSTVATLGFAGGKEIITYRRGTYALNPDIPVEIDAEEFEELLKKAEQTRGEEKLTCLLEAADLYKGDFLPKSALEAWVVPISTYYHSRYIKSMHELLTLLEEQERYPEIISVCQRAVAIDPYDESFHYSFIKALVETGAQQRAMQHYSYVKDLFFSQFGINPSPELTALYKEVVKTSQSTELDLSIIKDSLTEEEAGGAFFCEYEFFKSVYQLTARTVLRTGQSAYLVLLTITDSAGRQPPQKALNKHMELLKDCIADSLRKGDVFTRYSVSQYLIMLPSLSYENTEMVMGRVTRFFRHKYPKAPVQLKYSIQPLSPLGMNLN